MTAPESPAGLLRRAATLMRERAEPVPHGPWHWSGMGGHAYPQRVLNDGAVLIAECFEDPAYTPPAVAGYIASWHPEVAKAVAAWLDAEARRADGGEGGIDSVRNLPLVVARAYLGVTAPEEAVA